MKNTFFKQGNLPVFFCSTAVLFQNLTKQTQSTFNNPKARMARPIAISSLLLMLFVCLFANVASAQITYTWTGATSTDWNNTANWTKSSGTSTPQTIATDIVIIPTTSAAG